jgi:hypothetical protein
MTTTDQHAKIARQIAELDGLTVSQLQEKWEEVWQEPCRSRNKDNLRKRIAWRIQALAYGGLSQRALDRARELADEPLLRVRNTRTPPSTPSGETVIHRFVPQTPCDQLMVGKVLTREYQGRKLVVTVQEKGFLFAGQIYRSLSAVAKAVTGAHWNGRAFFGLSKTEATA